MNYYEHHIGDYLKDTAHLSMLEDAAYRRLIDAYYNRETPLPLVKKDCYKLARAQSKAEREAVDYVLEEFFVSESDGWHQKRCDTEIERFKDKQQKARSSANARWNKSQSEGNANASTDAMRTHSEGNANGMHRAPVPKHQTPDTNLKPVLDTTQQDIQHLCALSPGMLAAELIKRGVKVTAQHPTLLAWVQDGYTLDECLAALATARLSKPEPQPVPANYLNTILRAPPPEPRRNGSACSRSEFNRKLWQQDHQGEGNANIIDITPTAAEEGDRPAISAS